MTNEEIFNKAIDKANQNGYGRDNIKVKSDLTEKSFGLIFVYAVIFSHDFAKAFWGDDFSGCDCKQWDEEDGHTLDCSINSDLLEWKFRLQQMVLEEDPIKYLEKFL